MIPLVPHSTAAEIVVLVNTRYQAIKDRIASIESNQADPQKTDYKYWVGQANALDALLDLIDPERIAAEQQWHADRNRADTD